MWRRVLLILSPSVKVTRSLYARALEKPVRFLAEIGGCFTVISGGWLLLIGWMEAPHREYLVKNGYSVDEQGYSKAIDRRDRLAIDHLRGAGVDAPSPALLCDRARDLTTIVFLIETSLIPKRSQCGSGVDGSIDKNVLSNQLCMPWDGIGGDINQRFGPFAMEHAGDKEVGEPCGDPYSVDNINNVKALIKICENIDCPDLAEKRAIFRHRYSKLTALLPEPSARKEWFVKQCLANHGQTSDFAAKFQTLLSVRAAPLRLDYGHDGNPIQMQETMLACVGPRYGTDYDETIRIPEDEPYGVMACRAYTEKERTDVCLKQWPEVTKDIQGLEKFKQAIDN
jgi:hypothetical protein